MMNEDQKCQCGELLSDHIEHIAPWVEPDLPAAGCWGFIPDEEVPILQTEADIRESTRRLRAARQHDTQLGLWSTAS
jgi:hypothetical protein